MRWEVFAWAAIVMLLFAVEALAPGAFMLWLGFAAVAVFAAVWIFPGIPLVAQAAAFVVLSFVSIQIYRTWFRGGDKGHSDQPALNKRTAALIGRVVPLERSIVDGRGRVQIADAYWDVTGPDLPAGTPVRISGGDAMTLQVESAA